MNSSLYIGATGMKGLSEGMQVITNNLANVSTIGFKQQNILFSDVYYQTQSLGGIGDAQQDSHVAIGQVGMGLQVEAVRTKYTQGALESTNTMTDLAISGKGFFQVSDGTNTFYTRAGDFRQDNEGVWRNPAGYALNGYPIDANGAKGELSEVKVDAFSVMPSKATSSIELVMNVDSVNDITQNEANPYFSLLSDYNALGSTPLDAGSYGSSQSMTVYDSEGNSHTLTAYFDGAPSTGSGNKFTEFLIATPASASLDAEGNIINPNSGDGLLMSGVLEFDAAGNLVNVSAFTPGVEGSKNLEDWKVADLVDGVPTFNLNGSDISLNFGITANGGWSSTPASADSIGADWKSLPGMNDITRADFPTTSFATSSIANSYKQDGYSEGFLSNVTMNADGVISGTFSNGRSQDLWEVPVARFISEDGLRREGGNLFSATEMSGEAQLGKAGTENFGTIAAHNIENSNVDIANEMVNMIINQRGFQSNSKVVTTADQILQKAMEIKRT